MNWEKRNQFQYHLRTLLKVAQRLDARSFVAANDGNISVRLGNDRFLASRSGCAMSRIAPLDFLIVDRTGLRISDPLHPNVPEQFRVTSEWDSHIAIYDVRPDVNAVVHAHPPFATAWAVARQPFPERVLPEVIVTLRKVPVVPFAVPGTKDLAAFVAETARLYNTMLLANHGVISIGADAVEALDNLERVEHAAKILLLSHIINGPVLLSPEETAAIASVYPT